MSDSLSETPPFLPVAHHSTFLSLHSLPPFDQQVLHFTAGGLASLAAFPLFLCTRVARLSKLVDHKGRVTEGLTLGIPKPKFYLRLYGLEHARERAVGFWLADLFRHRLEYKQTLGSDTPPWLTAGVAGALAGGSVDALDSFLLALRVRKRIETEHEAKHGYKAQVVITKGTSMYVSTAAAATMWGTSMAFYEAMKQDWFVKNDGAGIPWLERWKVGAIAGGCGHFKGAMVEQISLREWEETGREMLARQTTKAKGSVRQKDREGRKPKKEDAKSKQGAKNKELIKKAFEEALAGGKKDETLFTPVRRLSLRWWKMLISTTIKGSVVFGTVLAVQDVLADKFLVAAGVETDKGPCRTIYQ